MHRYDRHDFRHPQHPSGGQNHERPHARWGDRAAFAPGYPIYGFQPPPYPRQYQPQPQYHAPRHPDLPPRHAPQRPLHPHHVHVNSPKRHVHFDIPHQSSRHEQHARRPSRPDLRRPATPAHPQRRPSRPDLRREPAQAQAHAHPEHRPPRPNPRQPPPYPLDPHEYAPPPRPRRPSPPPKPANPDKPTIHIITYALSRTPSQASFQRILTSYLPSATPHLYTINAATLTPPPEHLCLRYSGVSPVIQEHVMRDARARKAVREAVDELLWFRRREQRKEAGGRSKARKDVALTVCCEFGTHRSVSVAERIAREVGELGLGVRVRVVHVHRRRGDRDPY